jgi:two-component system response regulator (stage 0 sporulation protein F)
LRFFDRNNVMDLLEYLPAIKKDLKSWGLVDVALTGKTPYNVIMVAKQLEEIMGAAEGMVFVHHKDHILAFVKHAQSINAWCDAITAAIGKALPEYGCDVMASGLTVSGLRKMEVRLKPPAKEGEDAARSTLYNLRATRRKNVIMLVDDDLYMTSIIKATLSKYAECVVVHNPNLVLDVYLKINPDIVFLEMDFARASGLEILDSLMKYDKDVHVVMLTSAKTAHHVIAAKEKGVKGFVGKPFELPRLESEIFSCSTFTRPVV